ncbi:hypothetical protein [Clostridium perfringens]|uniref:hypothetical protein n=1 Tax=Clostridium perfringens TaxID=1502 RepID=UPI00374A75CA
MCKCRKYESYKVIVSFYNGEKEEIKYNGIKQTSYIDMLKAYRETKELYKDKSCRIDFIGVSANGELEVRWFKEFKGEEKEFQIKAREYTETNSFELMENIINSIALLNKRNYYLKNRRDVLEKAQDIILHKIEHFDISGLGNEEKLELFNELENIRKERREVKEDLKNIHTIREKIKFPENLEEVLNGMVEFKEKTEKSIKYLTDIELENKKVFKKKKYNNIEQRNLIAEKLRKKFDRVIFDDSKAMIYAYNKAI